MIPQGLNLHFEQALQLHFLSEALQIENFFSKNLNLTIQIIKFHRRFSNHLKLN